MINYTSGYKYQLKESYSIIVDIKVEKNILTEYIKLIKLDLSDDSLLCINNGYAWDGASGFAIDTNTFMRGSLVHDALYQLMREGCLDHKWREQADKALRRICLEDGMSTLRAWYVYRVVRKLALKASFPSSIKKIYYAP